MDRVRTNIKGFDKLIEGGFPRGSTILYTGSPGTGKTIFGLQFLYNGVTLDNQKGMIVSFEQNESDILEESNLFGWDLQKLINENKFFIKAIPAEEITTNTANEIVEFCKKNNIERLVIDSLTTLSTNAPIYSVVHDLSVKDILNKNTFFSPPIVGDVIVKRFIYHFISMLKKVPNLTTILISESSEKETYLSRDTVSEFICDGVILVNFESMGGAFSRSLMVRKMRKTKNDEDLHPLEISPKGIVIHDIK